MNNKTLLMAFFTLSVLICFLFFYVVSLLNDSDNALLDCEYKLSLIDNVTNALGVYDLESVNESETQIEYFKYNCNEYFKLKGWC